MTDPPTQAIWRTSTRSNGEGGNCVEFAATDGGVRLRDSKNPAGPVLTFGSSAWTSFIRDVKAGKYDLD
jgi:hypothetical protein